MKIEPQHIRFTLPFLPSLAHRTLRLIGRGNSIQLLETALVIEGDLKRLGFPAVDLLFQRLLCERTTVTIPYSQIEYLRYQTYFVRRWLLTVLFWLPCALLFLVALASSTRADGNALDWLYFSGMFGLLAIVLSLYIHWRMAPRHQLLFRRPDGGSTAVWFRIPSRLRRAEFVGRLERNREVVARTIAPPPPRPWRTSLSPVLILTVYLLAHQLCEPLWQKFMVNNLRNRLFTVDFIQREQYAPGLLMQESWLHYPVSLGWFLFLAGPVVLLASLSWRWNRGVRVLAVMLLLLHAVYPLIGPDVWRILQPRPGPGIGGGFGPPGYVWFSFAGVASAILHLLLATWLLLVRGPRTGEAVHTG